MIYHVFANRSNIGDWLSAQGIQALFGEPVIEHLCDEPFVAETLDALAELGPHDLLVIGGGGLFMDYFTPFWEGLLRLPARTPTCLWGVGYCDLKAELSRPPRALLRAVVARSAYCVVRDGLTCEQLGLDLPVAPCPSLCVIDPAPLAFGLLHADNYTTVGAPAYEVMDRVGDDFATATGRTFRTTNNRIEPGRSADLQSILNLYAGADIVLSSALHGCIIGLAMGRRVVAVSGDRKIDAMMTAAGLGDWVLDAADVGGTCDLLRRIEDQKPPLDYLRQARRLNGAVADRVRAAQPDRS